VLQLNNITISLHDKSLLNDVTLSIASGEIVTVMGPSGSGKSTLLSYIGGDLTADFVAQGDVILNDQNLHTVPPERRDIGRLFQDDLLFPHMTIAENLLFAIPHMPKAQRFDMMKLALSRAELDGFENRAPHTLSGGQRARISLMRTLLAKPKAILLDEPFSKLDQELRHTIRSYTFAHIVARNIPALLVTHDSADVPPGGRMLHLQNDGAVRYV
jgi:putative thiamine transport system ATP-binding protein